MALSSWSQAVACTAVALLGTATATADAADAANKARTTVNSASVRIDPSTGRFLAAETVPMFPGASTDAGPLFPYGAPPIFYRMTGERTVGADGSRARRITPDDLSYSTVVVGGDGRPRVVCLTADEARARAHAATPPVATFNPGAPDAK